MIFFFMNLSKNLTEISAIKIEKLFEWMNKGDKESLNRIFDMLKNDPCELVRHEAAFALGECISDKSIEVLKEVFEKDNSIVVKHECLMSLGTIGNKEDLEFIKKHLENPLFEVSCSARIAMDRIIQEEDFENEVEANIELYIKRLLDFKSTTQNDRIQILFQLMNIADEKSIDAIYECLIKDPCRVVRHEAGFVLGEIGTEKAVNYLISAIENENTAIVIHECLFALGTTGNESSLEFIEKYLNHENYVISESAKIAIDRIKILKNPYRGPKHYEYLKNEHTRANN